MPDVKITALEAENVKRIRAVEIEPNESGLTVIGGRNAQGKTSVLDAIMWALGGDRYKPDNPNRDGAAGNAKIRIELSNGIVVERKGKNGSLSVIDENGRIGGQRLLNEFVSQLALDLPKFMSGSDKEKADALLKTLGIDDRLAEFDQAIADAERTRTEVGRDARRMRAHADSLPWHKDVPDHEESLEDLLAEQARIVENNSTIDKLKAHEDALSFDIGKMERDIKALEKRLSDANEDMRRTTESLKSMEYEDAGMVRERIQALDATNRKVRANEDKTVADNEAKEAESEYKSLTDKVEGLRRDRMELLEGAEMPLDGIGIEGGMLTYGGQAWSDMSGAEQLKVATAIVRATKPECGFVLVDGLEQMDVSTLREFGEWAAENGLQIIGTRVSEGSECTVIIEDGMVSDLGGEF